MKRVNPYKAPEAVLRDEPKAHRHRPMTSWMVAILLNVGTLTEVLIQYERYEYHTPTLSRYCRDYFNTFSACPFIAEPAFLFLLVYVLFTGWSTIMVTRYWGPGRTNLAKGTLMGLSMIIPLLNILGLVVLLRPVLSKLGRYSPLVFGLATVGLAIPLLMIANIRTVESLHGGYGVFLVTRVFGFVLPAFSGALLIWYSERAESAR